MNKIIIVEKKSKIRKDIAQLDKEICTKNQISIINQLYLDVYGRPTDNIAKAREVIVANFGIN